MTIHTPASCRAVAQRLDRRNAKVEAQCTPAQLVRGEMQNGEALHRLHARCLQLSSGTHVHHDVVRQVLTYPNVISVGEAWFEGVPCQTYRYRE